MSIVNLRSGPCLFKKVRKAFNVSSEPYHGQSRYRPKDNISEKSDSIVSANALFIGSMNCEHMNRNFVAVPFACNKSALANIGLLFLRHILSPSIKHLVPTLFQYIINCFNSVIIVKSWKHITSNYMRTECSGNPFSFMLSAIYNNVH